MPPSATSKKSCSPAASAKSLSGQVGELVMRELKRLDKIAYIRFASVYKSFEDVAEFQDAVAEIDQEPKPPTSK